jgi:hypothetical protein
VPPVPLLLFPLPRSFLCQTVRGHQCNGLMTVVLCLRVTLTPDPFPSNLFLLHCFDCYFPGQSLVRPSEGILTSVCLPPMNSSFIMLSYPSAHPLSTILMTLTIPRVGHLLTPLSPGTEYLPPLAIIQPPLSFVTSRSGSKQHHLVVHTPTQWILTQN